MMTILALSDVQVIAMLPTSFKSIGLSEQNIDFQDGGHGGHLGHLIETIFAIFDLKITLMITIKFQVK